MGQHLGRIRAILDIVNFSAIYDLRHCFCFIYKVIKLDLSFSSLQMRVLFVV